MIVYEGEKDMKKEYVRPMMVGERFAPNEYVAACGDRGKVYKFECNAGEVGYINHKFPVPWVEEVVHHYAVYGDDGKQYGSNYGPCGKTHEAPSDSGFINGWMDDKLTEEVEQIPVIIWTDNGRNCHCTDNLNMESWETAKS